MATNWRAAIQIFFLIFTYCLAAIEFLFASLFLSANFSNLNFFGHWENLNIEFIIIRAFFMST